MGYGKRAIETRVPREGLGDRTHVEVGVFYSSGGANVFTGNRDLRGYYARVVPVTVTERSVAYTLFDNAGFKLFLKPAARFSEKTLRAVAATVEPLVETVADRIAGGDLDGAAALLLPLREAA